MFVIKISTLLQMFVFKEFNVAPINKDQLITNAFVVKDSQIILVYVQDALKVLFGVLQQVVVFLYADKILHILQLKELASVIPVLDF